MNTEGIFKGAQREEHDLLHSDAGVTPSASHHTTRRQFLKASSAAVIGGALAPAILTQRSYGGINSDTLRVGLIGCGGRGTGAAAQALKADDNVILTAIGDIYEDRLDSSLENLKAQAPDKVKVSPEHRFLGFDAYQKVIDSGVDVVLLTAPPGFRPLHLKAAVDAGKHVFAEKPCAVDGPGVRSVLASAEEAKRKNLALVAGLCWRYHHPKRATYQMIHDGAIGDIRTIYTTYNTGGINKHDKWNRQNTKSHMDWMMRRWYFFTWLSGDHIVEQAVHSIDKIAWAMRDVPPLRATATGGRQVRTDPEYGHIYDHFAVVYDYPDDIKAFHFCRQQDRCAGGVVENIMGTKGVCTMQGGNHVIRGEKNWRYQGPNNDKFQTEHDEMFASIRSGRPINDGTWLAHSTMLAVLGRMAAYTGQAITWEDALNSKEDLMPPRVDWDERIPVPPVAMPGVTRFV